MSWKVTALVRSRLAGSPTRKSILLVMADCANHDGSDVWLSTQTMANETEVSQRTIKRQLRDLTNDGLIVRVGEKPCMGGFTIIYGMDLNAISALKKSGDKLSKPPEKAVTDCPSVVTYDASERAPSVTQTVLEQSLLKDIPKGISKNAEFIQSVFDDWNDMARRHGLRLVADTLPSHVRWKHVAARLRDCGGDASRLRAAICNIPNNSHWLGANHSVWKADFDWIFKSQTNFTKALEYTQPDETKNANFNPSPESSNPYIAALQRNRAADHLTGGSGSSENAGRLSVGHIEG